MKNKKIIYLFLFLFSTELFSIEEGCRVLPGTNNTAAEDITKLVTNCSFAKTLVQNEEVKNEHLRQIYDKMAKKLAYQIKSNSQDLSNLDRYYTSFDQSLVDRKD